MKPKPLKGRTWNPYTIPDVINPGGVRCIQVFIPDSLQWLQIFAAVMDTMCHWKNYELLGDTSAAQCAALMRSIMYQYNTFAACQECPDGIEFNGEEIMGSLCEALRFHNGKLQSFCCGEWVDIAGQTLGAPGDVTQPPPGGEIPSGDCQTKTVALSGKDKYKLPFPVDDGYTITITDAQGGWWNGDVLEAWECPSGFTYALGECVSIGATDPTNPVPSLPYGRLIAQVGSEFLDAYNTTITVPVGTGPTDVYFQINDAILNDNQGSISFNVEVCALSPVTWCYEWNLLTERGPFAPLNDSGQSFGLWFAGVGWTNPTWSGGAQLTMLPTFDTEGCTHIEADFVIGTPIVSPQHLDILDTDGANQLATVTPLTAGGMAIAWTGDPTTGQIWLNGFNFEADPGIVTMTRIKMSGRGTGKLGPDTC